MLVSNRVLIEPALREAQSTFFEKGYNRSFVTVAFAQSSDGYLSRDGENQVVMSSRESLKLTHLIRTLHDGIIVGRNTVECDNPQLTVRHVKGASPQRLVISKSLSLSSNAVMFTDKNAKPWIFTSTEACLRKASFFETLGCRVFRLPLHESGDLCINALAKVTWSLGLDALMLEGGVKTIIAAVLQGVVDYTMITRSRNILDGKQQYRIMLNDGTASGQCHLEGDDWFYGPYCKLSFI